MSGQTGSDEQPVRSPASKLWMRRWGLTLLGGFLLIGGATLTAIIVCTSSPSRLVLVGSFVVVGAGLLCLALAKYGPWRYQRGYWDL
jgi:hypothetical protein